MGWRDLLQPKDERAVAPWLGGRSLYLGSRAWQIEDDLPKEHGWYIFQINNRKAKILGIAEEVSDSINTNIIEQVKGYLVGNRLIRDEINASGAKLEDIYTLSESVHLIEPGLDRFVRIRAGRFSHGGPLVYINLELPFGPEDEILQAFLNKSESITHIKNVHPALDLSFRLESWHRDEILRKRKEEQERREREEKRRQLLEQLGDGAGRRAMAAVDFEQAARAALAVGNATYLDHRQSYQENEMVVRFQFGNRQFECVCHAKTLRIIDAGICLVAHHGDPDFKAGEKGDNFLTLESLPSVIGQAEREAKLVIFRHVGLNPDEDDYDD